MAQNHKPTTMKLAAIGDLHMREGLVGNLKPIFQEIAQKTNILLLCGDLTDHGYIEEAEMLAHELEGTNLTVLAVLGNHDYTSGHDEEIRHILSPKFLNVLDKEPVEINGVSFVGTKGFGGGFDEHLLSPFGEQEIKSFVQTAVAEELKLEEQLSQSDCQTKVVVLHYSPIKETVIGEAEEIFPFMGSSRLAGPIDRFKATVAFHGHSHHGTHQGKTIQGIPVYNVCFSLMQKISPKQPYLIYEI